MRVSHTSDGLKVHGVGGTYVVMLGFDLPEAECDGLLDSPSIASITQRTKPTSSRE